MTANYDTTRPAGNGTQVVSLCVQRTCRQGLAEQRSKTPRIVIERENKTAKRISA